MKFTPLIFAAALACLSFTSGCAGCNDQEAYQCETNADCLHGRWCIEESCTEPPVDGGQLENPRSDAVGADTGSGQTTPPEELAADYCDMEAECINQCATLDGVVACNSDQRQADCASDFTEWYETLTRQGPSCAAAIESWTECISQASCGEVREFFEAHPDVVASTTPCASDYFKMDCIDFEPVTEYGF